MKARTLDGCGFTVADFFDQYGRLRPLGELPTQLQAHVALFEVVRVTTELKGETLTTEELIRVKTRDRRIAKIGRQGGITVTPSSMQQRPLKPRLVTRLERHVGSGRSAGAAREALDEER